MKTAVAAMPIAIIALVRLGPRKAASAMARIRKGQASIASVMREMSMSGQPPEVARERARPARPPSSEMLTDTTPASSEARAPQITRESTSRPISSVPNQ